MPDWRVEQLRLTVFLPTDLRQPAPSWWREIVGQEPPNQTIQQGIVIQHVGPVRGNYCQLALEIKSERVDWTFGPLTSEEGLTGFPSFDELVPSLQVFRELLLPWAEQITGVRRIAFGGVLSVAVPDRIAGYRALQPLLPSLTLDVERSSELLYQINRHATSLAIPGLRINRLCNWAVVLAKMAQFQIGPAGAQVVMSPNETALTAVRLQLDINTDADRVEPLPSDTIRPVCEELVNYGEQIAVRGDVS